jgi:hypothetical protein
MDVRLAGKFMYELKYTISTFKLKAVVAVHL